jgi:hypothetical protein
MIRADLRGLPASRHRSEHPRGRRRSFPATAGVALALACALTTAVPLGAVRAQDAEVVPSVRAAVDTLRTNLWLSESLMRDVVATVAGSLPRAPVGVRIVTTRNEPEDELLREIAADELHRRGYDVYLAAPPETPASASAAAADAEPDEDRTQGEDEKGAAGEEDAADLPPQTDLEASLRAAAAAQRAGGEDPAEYVLKLRIQEFELAYPETGRRLGIWRQWVSRRLRLSVGFTVEETDTGRLLVSDRVTRSYHDRVPSDYFDDVESDQYTFTAAELQPSGWQGKIEEIMVLGTLAGLVAVYFANTR